MTDDPVQTDLQVVQGQTKAFTATWTLDDVPKDISGYAAHVQFRKRRGSFASAPLVDVSSEDGSDPANVLVQPGDQTGLVKIRIPAAMTAPLKKNCWYDLWLINRSDTTERIRLAYGQVSVSTSATDNTALVEELIVEHEDVG